jgi:hypothetical protein
MRLGQRAELARILAERTAVAAGGSVAAAPRPRHLDERQGAPGGGRAGRALALHASARPRLLRLAFLCGRQAAAQPFAAHGAPAL